MADWLGLDLKRTAAGTCPLITPTSCAYDEERPPERSGKADTWGRNEVPWGTSLMERAIDTGAPGSHH